MKNTNKFSGWPSQENSFGSMSSFVWRRYPNCRRRFQLSSQSLEYRNHGSSQCRDCFNHILVVILGYRPTMRWHHSPSSPYGTFSITPRASSRSRSSWTLCCQWSGTGAGVWQARGVALSSTCISKGGPAMHRSGRCGHVLNVDDAK